MSRLYHWIERSFANGWTAAWYETWRAALGAYLCVHLASLVPWGAELFSRDGMLPAAEVSPLARVLPNVLVVWDDPLVVVGCLSVGVVLSLLLALGLFDRVAAIGLWYLWACLFARNPLIGNPGMPYVGWLLLAHACLPAVRTWRRPTGRTQRVEAWRLPPTIFAVAWLLLALGYTYSGLTKLGSPSWIDGSAVAHILDNPLARPTRLREALLGLPPQFLALVTWGALAMEILAAPLALWRRLRPWLWMLLTVFQLSLLVLLDFADLTLGMLLIHAFTFDPAWRVRARRFVHGRGWRGGLAATGG